MRSDNTMTLDAYQNLLARQDAEEKKTRAKRKTEHTESNLQRQCVTWFRLQYPADALMLFAVPNGGGRSVVEASIMKAEGVTAGVADLLLLEARGGWGCLCLEMKTKKKGSKQRPSQKAWQTAAERAGNRYEVVRTLEEFQTIVGDYMGLPSGVGRRVVLKGADMVRFTSDWMNWKETLPEKRGRYNVRLEYETYEADWDGTQWLDAATGFPLNGVTGWRKICKY